MKTETDKAAHEAQERMFAKVKESERLTCEADDCGARANRDEQAIDARMSLIDPDNAKELSAVVTDRVRVEVLRRVADRKREAAKAAEDAAKAIMQEVVEKTKDALRARAKAIYDAERAKLVKAGVEEADVDFVCGNLETVRKAVVKVMESNITVNMTPSCLYQNCVLAMTEAG